MATEIQTILDEIILKVIHQSELHAGATSNTSSEQDNMVLKEADGTEKIKSDKTIADEKQNMYEDLFLKGFRSDCTVACYKHSLNLFRSQVTKPVTEITMDDLRKWQSTLCDKPKSRRFILNLLS